MTTLSNSDRTLWRDFRRSYEQVSLAIERELAARTRLSGVEHGILSRVAEAGPGGMRQQQLADALRWDRTRLSHQLRRMEERGLVERSKLPNAGTLVTPTKSGEAARRAADPVHAEAVMKYFTAGLSARQRDVLASVAARLSSTLERGV